MVYLEYANHQPISVLGEHVKLLKYFMDFLVWYFSLIVMLSYAALSVVLFSIWHRLIPPPPSKNKQQINK